MMKKSCFFKFNIYMFFVILVLIFTILNAFQFIQLYNIEIDKHLITSFSFWKYMRVYGVGTLIMFFSPIIINSVGLNLLYEKINSNFLKFELLRVNYNKKMLKELVLCYWKGMSIFIILSIVIFIIGMLIFSNDLGDIYYSTYLTSFHTEAINNPYLYLILYHILIGLFCMFIINIGLICMYYIRNFYLIIIASFITINSINFVIGNLINTLASIIGNETFIWYAFNCNVYGGYMIQGTMSQGFIDTFILYIVSLIIVIYLYKDKEKVVMNFD